MTSEVIERLRLVPDPELGLNIVELGMVEQIDELNGHLRVHLVLTSPGCPLSGNIEEAIHSVLRSLPGVETVMVEFRQDIHWHPGRIDPEAREKLMGQRSR